MSRPATRSTSTTCGAAVTTEVLREATDRIMDAITVLLEDIRGEHAPAERFDPGRPACDEIGNPNETKHDGDRRQDDEQGGGVRCRLVGHGVLASCSPTPATRSRCGPVATELCATINEKRENTDYLPGIELPRDDERHTDPGDALAGAEFVVLAVPSQTLRENLDRLGRRASLATRCWSP